MSDTYGGGNTRDLIAQILAARGGTNPFAGWGGVNEALFAGGQQPPMPPPGPAAMPTDQPLGSYTAGPGGPGYIPQPGGGDPGVPIYSGPGGPGYVPPPQGPPIYSGPGGPGWPGWGAGRRANLDVYPGDDGSFGGAGGVIGGGLGGPGGPGPGGGPPSGPPSGPPPVGEPPTPEPDAPPPPQTEVQAPLTTQNLIDYGPPPGYPGALPSYTAPENAPPAYQGYGSPPLNPGWEVPQGLPSWGTSKGDLPNPAAPPEMGAFSTAGMSLADLAEAWGVSPDSAAALAGAGFADLGFGGGGLDDATAGDAPGAADDPGDSDEDF
jgi:hypothetical protein